MMRAIASNDESDRETWAVRHVIDEVIAERNGLSNNIHLARNRSAPRGELPLLMEFAIVWEDVFGVMTRILTRYIPRTTE